MLQFGWWRSRRIIAACLACALLGLAGCSTLRLAYNQGGTLGAWWLDGYLDLDEARTPRLREALAQWFSWHRREQLPVYAQLLGRAGAEVLGDSTPEQVCGWVDEIVTRLDVAVDRALPEAATVALGFGPGQLAQLERKFAKNNAAFHDDFLQAEAATRQQVSVDRAIERFEQLYGSLGEPQRARIAEGVAGSPFDPPRWLRERQRRQRDLAEVLHRLQANPPPPREAATTLLRGYWQRVLASPDEDYRRYQQALRDYNCGWLARVHNATTSAQRLATQRRLRGWESDLRALAGPR